MFYGWIIVAAGFAVQLLNGGLLFHAFSAYVLPLQAEFGWSRTVLASGFALMRMESGILGPVQGWLINRFGPRLVMTVGNTLFALGFLLFSLTSSLSGFYAALVVIALGSSLGGFMPIATTVTQWFARRRSLAIGLTLAGMGVGGLLVPVVVSLIQTQGWRWMATVSALLIACVTIPASQLMRRCPEDYGEVPDGGGVGAGQAPGLPATQEPDFTPSEALRTSAFWYLSLVHAAALLIVGTVLVHQIPHMVESVGMSQARAGSVVALLVVVVIAGQLFGGWLGDRIDKRWIIFGAMWVHAAAMILFAYAATPAGVVSFAVLHGAAWGARGTLVNSIRAQYFGRRAYAVVSGYSSLLIMMGMTAGPLFAGVMRDLTGSYRGAFVILAGIAVLASFAALLAHPPQRVANQSRQAKNN